MELLELLLRRRAQVGAVLAAALLLIVVVVVRGGGADAPEFLQPREEPEPALAERIPYDGRSPRLAPGARDQRVLVTLPRPALGERADLDRLDGPTRARYVASLARESQALRSALEARGVRLRDVRTFERTWNGFAATVRVRDIARLGSLGVRTRPIRRFYPALSEPVPDPRALDVPAAAAAGARIALLAGGAPGKGFDAVDGDRDPAPGADPRDVGRPEVSGTALERVLEDLGARVMPIRVAALRASAAGVEEQAHTDELLSGLEHAVDPDGDGDPSDGAAVALIGVSAPYAGFADAPEAEAAAGAGRLGTIVVAPAGHEGPGRGTIGSPGAARTVVTVGARAATGAPAGVELKVGGLRMRGAALLGGTPPGETLKTGGGPGQAAVVEATDHPAAAAARAVAAGAGAVVLAEPRPDRPLTAMPAGMVGVPVLGVTGAAAEALLKLPAGLDLTTAQYEPAQPSVTPAGPGGLPEGPTGPTGQRGVARAASALASSRGHTLDGVAKPDWIADATAPGVAGAGVAAARVAAALARAPAAPPAGAARPEPAGRAPRPRPIRVGRVELDRAGARVTGARFTVGAFVRADPVGGTGTRSTPAERLDLTLETAAGREVRRLTPPGGERGLLPGEYAYTLPARLLRELEAGRYRFVVRALGPRQRRPTTATSPAFRVT